MQLNVEIDDALLKRVKYACIEDTTNLKKWVSAALELALDFDQAALAQGWIPPGAQEPVEIVEEPPPEPPSKFKRVQKT